MSQIKVTSAMIARTLTSKAGRAHEKRLRGEQVCKACGSPLRDELSIQRGYGRCCFRKNVTVAIVLHIPAAEVEA